jgi:hypothetical protein
MIHYFCPTKTCIYYKFPLRVKEEDDELTMMYCLDWECPQCQLPMTKDHPFQSPLTIQELAKLRIYSPKAMKADPSMHHLNRVINKQSP